MNKVWSWTILWIVLSAASYVYMLVRDVPVWMNTNRACAALLAGLLVIALIFVVYKMIWQKALAPLWFPSAKS